MATEDDSWARRSRQVKRWRRQSIPGVAVVTSEQGSSLMGESWNAGREFDDGFDGSYSFSLGGGTNWNLSGVTTRSRT
jgi:hypothetical protein